VPLQRYVGSLLLAALVTTGVFLLMQSLVWRGRGGLGEKTSRTVLEFVRVRQDTDVETKQRHKPDRVKPEEAPPPPEMNLNELAPPDQQLVGLAAPDVSGLLDLEGTPQVGGAAGDTDVIPLVRVNPQYPPRARSAGIEGWVHLRFTVTAQGGTKSVEILDADPRGYFEKAAANAVAKFKYRPRSEDGTPVDRPGVEIVLAFKLKKS
jgi:protein TonB